MRFWRRGPAHRLDLVQWELCAGYLALGEAGEDLYRDVSGAGLAGYLFAQSMRWWAARGLQAQAID
jgi:hypothetical protein